MVLSSTNYQRRSFRFFSRVTSFSNLICLSLNSATSSLRCFLSALTIYLRIFETYYYFSFIFSSTLLRTLTKVSVVIWVQKILGLRLLRDFSLTVCSFCQNSQFSCLIWTILVAFSRVYFMIFNAFSSCDKRR